MSFGGLRDIERLDDFARHFVDVLALVPSGVRVEVDAERRGEHGCRKVFGIFARFFFVLAKRMMFRKVAVLRGQVLRQGNADRRCDKPIWLVGRRARHHAECNLAGRKQLQALFGRNAFAACWENARHRNKVALFDFGVAQGKLKRRKVFFVNAFAFGKKNLGWNK